MASSLPNCPPFELTAKYYSGTGDSCVRQSSFFGGKAVWLEKRYVGSQHTSEWFNTAGKNVKTGLIASVIVSQMGNHTTAHLVFLTFCFLTNIVVMAMLLLGGSAVVNALTGVNIYAASFLIPLGVIVYTLAGGLKATFLASYIHSVIVHVVLVVFVYLVYTSSSKLGSPSIAYHRLLEVAGKSRVCQEPLTHNGQSCGSVRRNYKGSYLTMLSSGGLIFGIINIVGNFGTVFVDNGYWVSAIAARPSSTHKGYLLGGLVWFAVPFSLATSLGLGALALDLPITASEASHGLVPPATAIALMGKGGSILLVTMLFMAVTSAGSSELIAVSCLCTFDIYRILRVSRGVVLGFGCFMGLLAVILNKAGVSLGWMYLAMGVFIGSAVLPIAFMLLWRKANAISAILGTTIGCVLGIITWLSFAKFEYGRVNLDTTGRNAPMLAGNLVSILTGGRLSEGYFTFWAIIAIAWGTIESTVIIVLPLTESWQTIQGIILGMFTNDRLMEKVEELNLKLHTIMLVIPEAERIYLLEKGKAKKNETSEPDAHIVPA
ncbi:hypothetical protein ACSBR1_037882 [Camellia fascicularis]